MNKKVNNTGLLAEKTIKEIYKMVNQSTYEKLNQMNLNGFVEALRIQMENYEYSNLSFEERIGLLVDFEWSRRQSNKISKCIKEAHLRYLNACVEDIEYLPDRKLDNHKY